MEGKQGLRVIRLSDANYLRSLENSIRAGKFLKIQKKQKKRKNSYIILK